MINQDNNYLKSASAFWTRTSAVLCFIAAASFMLLSLTVNAAVKAETPNALPIALQT